MPQSNVYSPSGGAIIPQNGSQPISVAGLQQPQTPINTPAQPPINTGTSTNASIPTPESIVGDTSAPTAADTAQSSLLGTIAEITQGKQSLATLQDQNETAGGVPGFAKTLTDLNTQLQGLNDQSTALQNEAQYTIPNVEQNNAEGKGITAGGLAPLTASDLRRNQIKQGAIASQSLTVKSAVYAAQGQYNLAKDAADKAAQVAFDAKEQDINYQKSLLDALAPTLSKEDKDRAALLSTKLADRQTQIDNQREDFKTGQGLAILAMKNNPDDQNAQYAAQQALKLDPNDPNYLQKVSDLVGKYQTDPVATQQAVLNLQKTRADIAYTNAQAAKANADAQGTALSPQELIAYANQYASSGQIPTGIPKGSFGAIAQFAKESPKPEGTIVNSATGVVPQSSQLSATQSDGLAASYDLTKKLDDLKTLYQTTNLLSTSDQRKKFTDLKGEIVDLLARARSGAALTEDEVATYSAKLPSLLSSGLPGSGAPASFGSMNGAQQIDDLKNSITGKLNTTLKANNAVIYGFSKVDVGGQQYTVGQTVTNDKGQTGTINADGTITLQ